MKWNQPPKKAVAPACANNMTFVKPNHGDAFPIEVPIEPIVIHLNLVAVKTVDCIRNHWSGY